MTLRYLMMMRRIDRVCGRMNSGLAAVAIALSLATGAVAVIRVAQFSAALASDIQSSFEATAQLTIDR